jgi:site-specific DNA-methyltransferase (adenine-specific)
MSDLRCGRAERILPTLPADSFGACVTDPPYDLTSGAGRGFMGLRWDGTGIAFRPEFWAEVLRCLAPGAHLLAFGGTRTYHRMACAIEDAGFEIRDSIHWFYGSGFPKSMDVSKAIDKAAGAEREVIGVRPNVHSMGSMQRHDGWQRPWMQEPDAAVRAMQMTAPATDAAEQWQGWGTALKPAHEPIILARKPLIGTVAENVLAHGCGGLNVDACRVASAVADPERRTSPRSNSRALAYGMGGNDGGERHNAAGRWPTNLVLTHHPDCNGACVEGCPVAELDRQSGERKSGAILPHHKRTAPKGKHNIGVGENGPDFFDRPGFIPVSYGDTGGASRFFPVFSWTEADFIYVPKASRKDRGEGNAHPCVKPQMLMRWICRLACPPGLPILDPFAGSGSTLLAAVAEGFDATGIEQDPAYVEIARHRLALLSGVA